MSTGHRYRADGWCGHPRCLRHIGDEADFGFCPDTSGNDIAYRYDVPPDKQEARRQRAQEALSGLVLALVERLRWLR